MKTKILQSIADGIINKIDNAANLETFDFYYELGLWFDNFCINYFDIYLN